MLTKEFFLSNVQSKERKGAMLTKEFFLSNVQSKERKGAMLTKEFFLSNVQSKELYTYKAVHTKTIKTNKLH